MGGEIEAKAQLEWVQKRIGEELEKASIDTSFKEFSSKRNTKRVGLGGGEYDKNSGLPHYHFSSSRKEKKKTK